MADNALAIYYEHPEWFRPLFDGLNRRKIEYTALHAAGHGYLPNGDPGFRVLLNRMSASAYTRGHGNAIFYTRYFLEHLENAGIRVINGSRSYGFEISKASQCLLLRSLRIPFPKTHVINSVSQITETAAKIEFPILVKPNIGGRGTGIVQFDSAEAVRAAGDQIDLGIDGTALVQELLPKRDGAVHRIEMLGGELLYGLRIVADAEQFNLCPAEFCLTEAETDSSGYCLTDTAKSGLVIERFDPPESIVDTVKRIVRAAQIDVGGVEYLIDDRTGLPVFFDINTLSNFVADAVNVVGFDPYERLIDFLAKEIELCDTDTGFRSLAVG